MLPTQYLQQIHRYTQQKANSFQTSKNAKDTSSPSNTETNNNYYYKKSSDDIKTNIINMGRRKLLPNINNLLLHMHLPQRKRKEEEDIVTVLPADNHVDKDDSTKPTSVLKKSSNHSPTRPHRLFTWPRSRRNNNTASTEEDDHYDSSLLDNTDRSYKSSFHDWGSSRHSRSSSQKPNSNRSIVSFGECQIRTYQQVLGDHPCCSEGCPVQLGWNITSEKSMKIDDYERVFHVEDLDNTSNHSRSSFTPDGHYIHPLLEMRLTAEERRSILIKSIKKQYEFENEIEEQAAAKAYSSKKKKQGKKLKEKEDRDSSGTQVLEAAVEDFLSTSPSENDSVDSTSSSTSERISEEPEPQHAAAADNSTSEVTQQDDKQPPRSPSPPKDSVERELSRECRRMNRKNANVKASRKRSKRNQEEFFGTKPESTKSKSKSKSKSKKSSKSSKSSSSKSSKSSSKSSSSSKSKSKSKSSGSSSSSKSSSDTTNNKPPSLTEVTERSKCTTTNPAA